MKIPQGYTEAQVLAAVEKAVNILAPSFVFGTYDLEDVKQHGFLIALKVLEKDKFDTSRPLANFLYTSIKNGYINLKRDEYRRNDPPCPSCHAGTPCPKAVGPACPKYQSWFDRNQAKANIANPLALEHISDEGERRTRTSSSAEQEAEIGELLQTIDAHLPVELRASYLQMRAGVSVPKGRRLLVEQAVKDILKGALDECPSGDA